MQWVPAKIANARKGDLILCADDGRGTIGTLLAALAAPQVYSHMGIMIDDYLTVRHSTMSDDRMTDSDYVNGITVAGTGLPLDGFEPEVVQIGWPGTITQSVDEAFRAQDPAAVADSTHLSSFYRSDRDNGTTPPEALASQDGSHCYSMAQLSFNTVYGQGGDKRTCLVVSPCTAIEQQTPVIREILHGVADEAKAINGHYRFYAYTDASVAQDPSYQQAGPMSVFAWDRVALKWVATENSAFDPASPCAPVGQQAPVQHTVPVVCSSLVWLAVQNFNASQSQYHVLLSAGEAASRLKEGCSQLVRPNMAGLVQDPQSLTFDGLYYFTPQDRAAAAAVFDAALKTQVLNTVAVEWGKIANDISIAESIALLAIVPFAYVIGVLESIGVAIAVVAEALHITAGAAGLIVALLSDMPQHVANQVCNTFAFDDATDHSTTAWSSPGPGRAVGPEDIIWFWGPTAQIVPGTPNFVQGIYGQNQPLILRQPGWVPAPQCQWSYSPGDGTFIATVILASGGMAVANAVVDVACHQGITNAEGAWEARLPAGTYWASAWFQDAAGVLWSVQEPVEIAFDEVSPHLFVLAAPSIDYREVNCTFTADAFPGSLWASGNPIEVGSSGTIYLGPRGNPAMPYDPSDPDNPATGTQGPWDSGGMTYKGDHQVGVSISALLAPGGVISGTVTYYQNQSGHQHQHGQFSFGPVAPGGQEGFTFHMSTGGVLPDHITGSGLIVNAQGNGPAA